MRIDLLPYGEATCERCGEAPMEPGQDHPTERGWCLECLNTLVPDVDTTAGPACSYCGATDVVGPFEMDGWSGGEYRTRGLWWIVCRACNRSTLVEAVA